MLLTEIKRPRLEPLPRRPRLEIDPALMTLQEYSVAINPDRKSHSSRAYQYSLKQMNQHDTDRIENYPRLIQRTILRGIPFEFRLRVEHMQSGKPYYYIGAFNAEKQKVATAQDEWGCMLVAVCHEYRGFGLGPIMTKIAYDIEPGKNTGGVTYAGSKVVVKTHREAVRQALVTGRYTAMIKSGELTKQRAKEIIDSAKLEVKSKVPKDNLASHDPEDWLLFVGEYGDFILYDRKLRDLLAQDVEHDPWDTHSDNSYWKDRFIKGIIYVHQMNTDSTEALIYNFYGADDRIKRFMMGLAISFCADEKITLWVDPNDQQYVGKFAELGDESLRTGFRRLPVVKVNETLPYKHMGIAEELFRRSFDKYDEFKTQMMELGFGMMQKTDEE